MIYEYLYTHHTHPTAEEIFKNVKRKNSRLSKMTVYNILGLLEEANLIRSVTINDKEARYDIKTRDHGHFKCKQCNAVFDFDVNMESIDMEDVSKFTIEKKDLFFYGICNQCLTDIDDSSEK